MIDDIVIERGIPAHVLPQCLASKKWELIENLRLHPRNSLENPPEHFSHLTTVVILPTPRIMMRYQRHTTPIHIVIT